MTLPATTVSQRRRHRALPSLLAISYALAALPPGRVWAQTGPDAAPATVDRQVDRIDRGHSALWVGNSYFYSNNSMHSHVEALHRSGGGGGTGGGGYRAISATISGAGIDWHDLRSYLRPGGLGTFRFTENNQVVVEPAGRRFDSVLLMDCSQCATHPVLGPGFVDRMARQVELVRAHGAEPLLFMSWAYQDRPEMSAALETAYVEAGRRLDARVIPAGVAFARALSQRPDIRLHQPDLRHPTMRGTYLAACTVYAATTGRSPVGNPYTAGIDPEIARFLQSMAWATVQEFQGRPPTPSR
jgi:hypothetical protein